MSAPRVAGIVQARTGSTRMPGKVLAPLAGAPALQRLLERARRSRGVDRWIVATSTEPADDRVAALCRDLDVPCARGPLDDVLARFLLAAPEDCAGVVRLTGDCPLVDPALVARHVAIWRAEQPTAEYVSNAVERSMPDGLDVEIFSRAWLERAAREAAAPFDREHVTPWIRRHARGRAVTQAVDLSALRWTLDTPQDYAQIAAIFAALHPTRPAFASREVYGLLLERPELIRVAGRDALEASERAAWRERIAAHLARADEDGA